MKTSVPKSDSMQSSVDLKGSPDVNLISLTYSNKLEKIVNFLDNNLEFDLLPIKDVRLYTLLHIACLNNQINICRCLFHHLKYNKASEDDVKIWVNSKTDEGFTALHFASFKGNIELVKLLEFHGADIHAKNNQGLTVIHIAAQGDQPVSIAYFQSKGLSLNQQDNKGSTPLHWAAFLGMENATTYLTSWGCSPNAQDNESGLTPLHLAVISGNPRVVRRLLIKGADKSIQNKEGKIAMDLAQENEYDNIVQLLQNKNWLLNFLNIKPSLQKKRTRFSLFLFVVLFLVMVGSNVFFIFPFITSIVWVILFAVFASLTLIFFLLSWLSDPGYMKNTNKGDILNLLLNNDPHLVCPECVIVKPLRSKHCEYCNACISVYDHHCPWINNCVGARNHGHFIIFTISALLAILVITAMGIYFLKNLPPVYQYFPAFLTVEENLLKLLKLITCAADILAALIFVFPLFALNIVQASNIFGGKTTSERFGFNVTRDNLNQTLNQSLSSEMAEGKYSKIKEPNGKISQSFHNCITMCCLNKRDNRYTFQSKISPNETSQNMDSELSP